MSGYNPDRWLLIKFTPPNNKPTFYKVFGTWSGSYLYGSSWKLSSGVESAKYNADLKTWILPQSSGSTYYLHENAEGTTGMWDHLVVDFKKQMEELGGSLEIINNPDFATINW